MNLNHDVSDWWLERVRLETAFVEERDGLARTDSCLGALHIVEEVITEVRPFEDAPDSAESVVDGDGLLIMPTFRDTHIHLDKTFYGGPWRTPIPGRFWLSEEERFLPEMSEQIPVRSNAILDLLVANGTTEIVAHCNVDHIVGTQNVARLLEVLRKRQDIDWTLVAYPQHGLRNGEVEPLLREAIELGATSVGGIDPARIESDIGKALDVTFGLAADYGVGVDFHLHDGGSLGLFEMEQVVRYANESGLQGKVALSCASALAGVSSSQQQRMAEELAAAGISVSLTVGVAGSLLPVHLLDKCGVEVSLGSDSIMDILTPFGQGDILEQLWILAQRTGCFDERSIAGTLVFGAGPPGRWLENGTRGWPNAGDRASFILTPAVSSAEAIARRTKRNVVIHRGHMVSSAPGGRPEGQVGRD